MPVGFAPGEKQGAVWEKQGCGAASKGSRGDAGLDAAPAAPGGISPPRSS